MKTSDARIGHRPPSQSADGFTLIELTTVIGIIGILAGMLLTSVTKATGVAQSLKCKNNQRQLQLAWTLYAHDHEDKMPPNKLASWNFDTICPEGYYNASGSWVMGNAMDDVTPWNLQKGVLFPYNSSLEIYHCPSDKSKVDNHPKLLRNRSYAMSYCMNGDQSLSDGQHRELFPLVKEKTTQLETPAKLFVFIDEAPQSIADGTFFLHYPGDQGEREAGPHWMDIPADRHAHGCNLTFADGHVDPIRWRAPKETTAVDQNIENTPLEVRDLRTLQAFIPEPPVAVVTAATGR